MGQVIISGGAGGGITSDEVTAIANYVLKGQTYVGSDTDDEIGTGTLELTGTATDPYVLEGRTFYNTDALTKVTGTMVNISTATTIDYTSDNETPVIVGDEMYMNTNSDNVKRVCIRYGGVTGYVHGNTLFARPATDFGEVAPAHVLKGETFTSTAGVKVTGTMEPNSLTSFKAAVASGRNVTLTWTVPTATTGKPYGGIHVRYKTGSAPTSRSDGTQIYVGNNGASSGSTSVTVTLPALSTTYYFSAWCYVYIGDTAYFSSTYATSSCTTGAALTKNFTDTTTYTIPSGYTKMDVFCVGGGGAGCRPTSTNDTGGGGGGGYTTTKTGITISSGNVIAVTIGAGAEGAYGQTLQGASSSVVMNNTTLATAAGGYSGDYDYYDTNKSKTYEYYGKGGDGGSGGGAGGMGYNSGGESYFYAGAGGTNGGNGYYGGSSDANYGGTSPSDRYYYGNNHYSSGIGQGSTTRPFGASSGTIYSGGGGGGYNNNTSSAPGGSYGGGTGGSSSTKPTDGTANSGGGGGGSRGGSSSSSNTNIYSSKGGSGIVIIKLY